MSMTTISSALARLGTETGARPVPGHIGRIYVMTTDDVADALADVGGEAAVVAPRGSRSRTVHGTTRPTGGLRSLLGRPRFVPCREVERTELNLATGTARIDLEVGTDVAIVRTYAPPSGTALDQALWWRGHRVAARDRD